MYMLTVYVVMSHFFCSNVLLLHYTTAGRDWPNSQPGHCHTGLLSKTLFTLQKDSRCLRLETSLWEKYTNTGCALSVHLQLLICAVNVYRVCRHRCRTRCVLLQLMFWVWFCFCWHRHPSLTISNSCSMTQIGWPVNMLARHLPSCLFVRNHESD